MSSYLLLENSSPGHRRTFDREAEDRDRPLPGLRIRRERERERVCMSAAPLLSLSVGFFRCKVRIRSEDLGEDLIG